MASLFELYIDRHLPVNEYRTRRYFDFDGAFYPECVYFWGDVFTEAYGWQPMEQRDDPLQKSGYHKWEWVAGPEMLYLALDYYEYSGDKEFLREKIVPTANAVIRFFDNFYDVGPDGKLVMHPAMACETWWDCTNPMPELAGLTALTQRLLALDKKLGTAEDREFWSDFQAKLPALPTREVAGVTAFAPAEKFAQHRNVENPELYGVFPFRLSSFNRPNAELGRNALKHRWHRGNSGWRQDDIFMAYLGETEQVRSNIIGRARKHDPRMRFPAFWGPNYDWTPDQTHGGVLMKTLQSMLMQAEPQTGSDYDGKIYLLPAWPKDWDVSFKLHAPGGTTVECEYRDGKVAKLVVSPRSRRKDVVIVE